VGARTRFFELVSSQGPNHPVLLYLLSEFSHDFAWLPRTNRSLGDQFSGSPHPVPPPCFFHPFGQSRPFRPVVLCGGSSRFCARDSKENNSDLFARTTDLPFEYRTPFDRLRHPLFAFRPSGGKPPVIFPHFRIGDPEPEVFAALSNVTSLSFQPHSCQMHIPVCPNLE